jgi:hypothetical protein
MSPAGGGAGAGAHGANVAAPDLVGSHLRDRNGGRVERRVAGELPVELNGGHHDQPGDDAAGEENSRYARANDVADTEIFGRDVHAEGSAGEPAGAGVGKFRPGEARLHEEGVDAAEAESPEDATSEGAAAFTGDENVGAGSTFRKGKVAVFLDDELAANGNHEKDPEPSAQKGQREDAPEGEFGTEAEEDERGDGEHDAGSERFAGGAGGLHDVVLEDGGAAEGAEDADGEDGDGNGCGDGEAGAEADVHGDGAEEESEEGA